MRRWALILVVVIIVVVFDGYLYLNQSLFLPPEKVDVYDGQGGHKSFDQPALSALQPVERLWNRWNLYQSDRYPNGFPDDQYRSYEYIKMNPSIVLHYATPVTLKDIQTKEIQLIDFQDPYLKNQVFFKDEKTGQWFFIRMKEDSQPVIREVVSKLQ